MSGTCPRIMPYLFRATGKPCSQPGYNSACDYDTGARVLRGKCCKKGVKEKECSGLEGAPPPTDSSQHVHRCGKESNSPDTNVHTCKLCNNTACASNEYRTGTCGGSDGGQTNNYTCNRQPLCPPTHYLGGATATRRGDCVECANVTCSVGMARVGECSGSATLNPFDPLPVLCLCNTRP